MTHDKNNADPSSPGGMGEEEIPGNEVDGGRHQKSVFKKVWGWFRKGKITYTNRVPFQQKDEKFKGIKVTWPWW